MGRPALWSADERQLLHSSASYDDYRQRGGTRTDAACATRRYHDKQAGYDVPEWPRGGKLSWGLPPESEPEMAADATELPERGDLALDEYYELVKLHSYVSRHLK